MQVNRDDLVEAAQKCLDDEIAERRLDRRLDAEPAAPPVGDPNWTEGWESVCVFHSPGRGSLTDAREADEARAAIADAGISCRIECAAADEAEGLAPGFEFRVMVPNGMLLRATSVLDVTIFNRRQEELWKAHLAELSDPDLHAMRVEDIVEGLLDRAARLTRAYEDGGAWVFETSRQQRFMMASYPQGLESQFQSRA